MSSFVYKLLKSRENLMIRLCIEGIMVGFLAGLIAVIYRLLLTWAENVFFYAVMHIENIVFWIAILVFIAWIVSKCLKFEPLISGSGIPQVEAEVQGYIDSCWYKVIVSKIVAGTLCILSGLSLGREGPSIQLGAMAGKAISRAFKRLKYEERFLLTCGGGAGLAAAFNAPLAGIMFSLEEIHKNFSTKALVSVMCACLTGDFVSRQIFGLEPSLHYIIKDTLPLDLYVWLIVLGIVTGIMGVLYNHMTMNVLKLYDHLKIIPMHMKVFIPFIVAGILGLFMPEVMGGGHRLIEMLKTQDFTILILLLLLGVKWLFSMICFGSGAPGGIFFPMLVLGSLIGAIFSKIAIILGVPEMYYYNFIVVAMAGFFAAIVKAPITGIILIAEMCGTLHILLPIAIVSLVAYLVSHTMHNDPIYDSLQKRLVKNQAPVEKVYQKELVTFVVGMNSYACRQCVQDLSLPSCCLLVSVVRGSDEMIPHGDTCLLSGDCVVLLIDKDNQEEMMIVLGEIFEDRKH